MNLNTTANYNPIGTIVPRDKMLLQKLFFHKHMVETLERFEWTNLPKELTGDLIERILFFRSKGVLFKGVDEKFRFLPFHLSGSIDLYGRYTHIIPVIFTGQNVNNDKDKSIPYFKTDMPLKVVYSEDDEGEAVILNDSSLEVSQDLLPMAEIINPIIEQQTEILVLINIDLISSAKVFYIVANDEAEKEAIEHEFQGLDDRILNGKRVVVLTAKAGLEELNKNDNRDSNRYFQVYQSFENLRKDIIGRPNSGTFMKNSIQTDDEVAQNVSDGTAVLNNALRQRKEFCDLVNATFGLGISVDVKGAEQSKILGVSSNNSDKNDGTMEDDE